MANAWPAIQPPSGCKNNPEDPAIKSKMESGSVQSRAGFTRIRGRWALSWDCMDGADYKTLEEFYYAMRGGSVSFVWTHPHSGKQHNVRFTGSFEGNTMSYHFMTVNCSLEEL